MRVSNESLPVIDLYSKYIFICIVHNLCLVYIHVHSTLFRIFDPFYDKYDEIYEGGLSVENECQNSFV